MRIAAKQIITSMNHSGLSHGIKETIDLIPKKSDGPLSSVRGTCGWGIRAVDGYSMQKILCWLAFVTVLGLVFVVNWLVLVSKTDLQNGFVVPTFLGGMLMAALAIPQILGVA